MFSHSLTMKSHWLLGFTFRKDKTTITSHNQHPCCFPECSSLISIKAFEKSNFRACCCLYILYNPIMVITSPEYALLVHGSCPSEGTLLLTVQDVFFLITLDSYYLLTWWRHSKWPTRSCAIPRHFLSIVKFTCKYDLEIQSPTHKSPILL